MRVEEVTRNGPRDEDKTVPGLSRCVWSVQSWTTTSPRRPWALVTRPTLSRDGVGSVVDDVHVGLDAVLGTRHVDQSPDGLGRPAPPADDPAHVVGRHVQAHPQPAPALVGLDDHGLGVVGQRLGQVGEDGPRRAAVDRGDLVALPDALFLLVQIVLVVQIVQIVLVVQVIDVVYVFGVAGPGLVDVARLVQVRHLDLAALAAANSSQAPDVLSRRSTRSVGLAPLTSHFTALALSMVTTASGSAVDEPRGA